MSYILDALRRLEQDKEAARKPANPIETVLHFDPAAGAGSGRASKRTRNLLILVAAPVVLFAMGATFWVARKTAPPTPAVRTAEEVRDRVPAPEAAIAPQTAVIPREAPPAARKPLRFGGVQRFASTTPAIRPEALPIPRELPSAADLESETIEETPPVPVEVAEEEGVSGDAFSAPAEDVPTVEEAQPVEDIPPVEEVQEPAAKANPEALEVDTQSVPVLGSETGLKISAIVWSTDVARRFAVVNLKTVHVGDRLGDNKVVEILEDAVVFDEGGSRFQVKMGSH